MKRKQLLLLLSCTAKRKATLNIHWKDDKAEAQILWPQSLEDAHAGEY